MSDIAIRETEHSSSALAMYSREQVDILKRLICPDATDLELELFAQVCKRTGLDPMSKQIYGIKRKGRLTIQTGIDGFRLTAQRSHEYAGQEGPFWCGPDGVWRDVWLSKDAPSAAKVGVYRTGWTRPVWGIATWTEYAQFSNGQPVQQWGTQPSNMLAKCAEAQALRKAFPAELSGLYGKEEMDQAERDEQPIIDATPAPATWSDKAESKWQAGVTLARSIGAAVPNKTAKEIESLRALAANISARQTLLDRLREAIRQIQEAGGGYDEPEELMTMPDQEIRDLIGHAEMTLEMAQTMEAAAV